MTNINAEKLLAVIRDLKKQAAIRGHSTDHDTNLFEMGKAAGYQHIERLLEIKLNKRG